MQVLSQTEHDWGDGGVIWLHNCPKLDDNYGPQVVNAGEKCPFCGILRKELLIQADESQAYGNDCPKGVCEW